MPMFLIFAGFFSAYMIHKYQTSVFIQKRFKRIVLPFLVAVVVFIPFQLFVELKFKYNHLWLNYFEEMVNPISQSFSLMHLWFLYHIIIYSGVLVTVYWLMKRLALKRFIYQMPHNEWMVVFIWLLIGYLFYRCGRIIDNSLSLHSTWLSFNDIGVNLPFFLFGLHFYINRNAYEKGLIPGTSLSVLVYLGASIISLMLDLMIDDFSSIFIIFTKWMHVLLVLNVFKLILNYTSPTLNYFSNASYAVYVLHQPVIVVVSSFTVQYFDHGSFYLNYFLLVAMCLLMTYLVYELLVRRCTLGRLLITGTRR
jgi:peptidoglycan/LPS O-acetylase OafA/YrhL